MSFLNLSESINTSSISNYTHDSYLEDMNNIRTSINETITESINSINDSYMDIVTGKTVLEEGVVTYEPVLHTSIEFGSNVSEKFDEIRQKSINIIESIYKSFIKIANCYNGTIDTTISGFGNMTVPSKMCIDFKSTNPDITEDTENIYLNEYIGMNENIDILDIDFNKINTNYNSICDYVRIKKDNRIAKINKLYTAVISELNNNTSAPIINKDNDSVIRYINTCKLLVKDFRSECKILALYMVKRSYMIKNITEKCECGGEC